MKLEIKDGAVKLDGRPLERVASIDILHIGQNEPMEAVIQMDTKIPAVDPEGATEITFHVPLTEINVEFRQGCYCYGMN